MNEKESEKIKFIESEIFSFLPFLPVLQLGKARARKQDNRLQGTRFHDGAVQALERAYVAERLCAQPTLRPRKRKPKKKKKRERGRKWQENGMSFEKKNGLLASHCQIAYQIQVPA